jgi:hypothetical protein
VPLLVTAGCCDAFAPALWLVTLTHAAASRSAQVVRLQGSHNNPFTHPSSLAAAVESAVREAACLRRVGTGRARRQIAVSRNRVKAR